MLGRESSARTRCVRKARQRRAWPSRCCRAHRRGCGLVAELRRSWMRHDRGVGLRGLGRAQRMHATTATKEKEWGTGVRHGRSGAGEETPWRSRPARAEGTGAPVRAMARPRGERAGPGSPPIGNTQEKEGGAALGKPTMVDAAKVGARLRKEIGDQGRQVHEGRARRLAWIAP